MAIVSPNTEYLLDINDLKDVYNATFDVSSNWKLMLLNLDLHNGTIERVRESPKNHSAEQCYMDRLERWLNRGNGSWIDAINALQSPGIQRNDLAKKIIIKCEFVCTFA